MFVVLAEVESSLEDLETMKESLIEMERETRRESGCHDYVFCQEISDPTRLRIVERWGSMEALKAHFASPHMATFGVALAKNPPRSMKVALHELGEELELPR